MSDYMPLPTFFNKDSSVQDSGIKKYEYKIESGEDILTTHGWELQIEDRNFLKMAKQGSVIIEKQGSQDTDLADVFTVKLNNYGDKFVIAMWGLSKAGLVTQITSSVVDYNKSTVMIRKGAKETAVGILPTQTKR